MLQYFRYFRISASESRISSIFMEAKTAMIVRESIIIRELRREKALKVSRIERVKYLKYYK